MSRSKSIINRLLRSYTLVAPSIIMGSAWNFISFRPVGCMMPRFKFIKVITLVIKLSYNDWKLVFYNLYCESYSYTFLSSEFGHVRLFRISTKSGL